MKQTLHIFLKDVRLFYLEILASLLIIFAFVKLYPAQWGVPATVLPTLTWLPEAATALVPVSWLLLIARVIHAESIVGERQFWITRPYRWPNLMAAKALFILAFVYVPFFIAQCGLRKEAGFQPFAHLPGIFFNLAMATGILVLPIIAIATVTSSFARMSLALLILLIYIGMMAYFYTLLPTANASADYGEELAFGVLVCLVVTIIVIQYATRRTLLARLLMVTLALTVGLLALFGPDDFEMRITYPVTPAAQHPALELAFDQPSSNQEGVVTDSDRKEIELSIPLRVWGVLPGTAIKVDNARVSITDPDGGHWESHWQSVYLTWLPDQTSARVSLKVSKAFFERVKTRPVSVELSLALTELNPER